MTATGHENLGTNSYIAHYSLGERRHIATCLRIHMSQRARAGNWRGQQVRADGGHHVGQAECLLCQPLAVGAQRGVALLHLAVRTCLVSPGSNAATLTRTALTPTSPNISTQKVCSLHNSQCCHCTTHNAAMRGQALSRGWGSIAHIDLIVLSQKQNLYQSNVPRARCTGAR